MSKPAHKATSHKPGRPFGFSVALAMCVMIFTVFPLAQQSIHYFVANHFNNLNQRLADQPADLGPAPIYYEVQANIEVEGWALVAALLFLAVAAASWVGKPPALRFALLTVVLFYATVNIAAGIANGQAQAAYTPTQGLDSGQATQSINWGWLLVNVGVTAYTVWYLNRAPVRAFFRGYYLKAPATAVAPSDVPADSANTASTPSAR
jgi:glucan phosphoethanolaminetransferase (alkaline phosphatase superfamily)